MHRMTKTYNCSFFLRSSSSLCSLSRSSFSSLAADGLGLVGRALLRLLLGASPPEPSLVLLGEMRDPAWGAIASLLSSSTIPSDSSSLDDGSSILVCAGSQLNAVFYSSDSLVTDVWCGSEIHVEWVRRQVRRPRWWSLGRVRCQQ